MQGLIKESMDQKRSAPVGPGLWRQPGLESERAVAFCQDHNMKVVHSVCVILN